MKFSQYHISDRIKKNLHELGFLKPTDIQYKSIPSIMKGEDVLAIAQTGTGKTAAFAIPIIDKLYTKRRHRDNKSVRCLVMVPTRELAVQISEVFSKIAKSLPLNILTTFGGADQTIQIEAL
jgi:ATP-dependent RNA helicase RhlE